MVTRASPAVSNAQTPNLSVTQNMHGERQYWRMTNANRVGLVIGFILLTAGLALAATNFEDALVFRGGVTFGSTGTALSDSYAASSTQNIGSISANTCTDSSAITVTGAAVNDACAVGTAAAIEAGLSVTCFVSAADAVKVRLCNVTVGAVDPANQAYAVRVFDP